MTLQTAYSDAPQLKTQARPTDQLIEQIRVRCREALIERFRTRVEAMKVYGEIACGIMRLENSRPRHLGLRNMIAILHDCGYDVKVTIEKNPEQ